MAVMASREVVIDALPEAIIDTIANVEALPTWSKLHRSVWVLDRYPDGRPHHVKATVKLMGFTDTELVEYHWGENWVVWDAQKTKYQRGQHAEYNLTREGDVTRVRFDIVIDSSAPVPGFVIERATNTVLENAIERLQPIAS